LQIETLAVEALRPYARNARTHSNKQIRQIAKSIQRFGFCNPVLIDDQEQIIAFPMEWPVVGDDRLLAVKNSSTS
jgi:ParB-like chromosome segregation protein Spo0J